MSYICQKAQIDKNAKPTKNVLFVFSFIILPLYIPDKRILSEKNISEQIFLFRDALYRVISHCIQMHGHELYGVHHRSDLYDLHRPQGSDYHRTLLTVPQTPDAQDEHP